jgi:PAS domain S-box-containing protein
VAEAAANLLLVDDRAENLLALEAVLEPLGQNLVLARSGEEALRHLLDTDFAVILLDVQMPGMDGFETATLIKQRTRTRAIPIIFLTAVGKDSRHVFRGYESGAVDYLFKPFEPEILRSKVSVFIELHEKTLQLRRQSEQLREQELAEVLRASEARYRGLAEAMPQMVWTTAPDGTVDYNNKRWSDYTGIDPEQASWEERASVIHPADRPRAAEKWHHCVESGEPYEQEYRLRRGSDGAFRWHLGRALPLRDEHGTITGWVGTSTDIDDHKRVEEGQRFLVEAGAVLGGSLDYRSTLADVARLAVPEIADWCAVDVLEEDGSLRQLAVAHADPTKVALAEEMNRRYPPDPSAETGARAVIRSGRPELVPVITEEMLAAAGRDELHGDLIRELGLRSYMCVPLTARDRTFGAITFIGAESGRSFTDADLALAEELARRAAVAVDNAQLYREAEARGRAARVLDSIADGVFLLDGAGLVRLWNPAAEEILGLAEADVLGRPAADVIPGWDTLAPRIPVAGRPGAAAGTETVPLELDGRERWLSISGVGFAEGTVYAFRDSTEQRALESLRQDLVATVSHELRTPLAAIYGSALTLRRDDVVLDDELRRQLLEVISEESDRLAEIVNDLLLASQLDSGRLQVSIERCDAAEIVRSVVVAAQTHLPENISLEVKAPSWLPDVRADRGQLQQVLANLVDNAIKYSPDGGAVRVQLAANERFLHFTISDQGLGIPAGEETRIFEKFYRLDPNMTRGIGGTGLGLYICRELIRRVDGRVWVESREGSGSAFHVEIPLAEAPAQPPSRRTARRTRTRA